MNRANVNTLHSIDLGFVRYELRADNVVIVRLQDELMIDLEKAEKMNETLISITSGTPKKLLVFNGQFTSADTEARTFLASHSKLKQIEKCSVTIHSLSQRILANFFIKVNKPPFPIRFFTSKEAAEKWLLKK